MKATRTVSWSSSSMARIIESFKTDVINGLSEDQIASARKRYGPNILETKRERGILGRILAQFKNPLVYVLLFAGIVTLALREFVDTIVIFIALFVNVFVGVFQEERASRAFQKLKNSQERFATVLRNGEQSRITSEAVVPGDIVILESGYAVPADVRLLEINSLLINESALTGESAAVSKRVESRKAGTPLTEQFNMAWMGTLVVAGTGKGVVVATGPKTEVGKIAEHLGRVEESPTPLQQSIRKLAHFLMFVIGSAIILIFIIGLLRDIPFFEILLTSIAVAVAAMPTGLPAAVTVVLVLGMESILKRGGLVRNLLAAETLGATTIILTDKTGTLTQGRMQVVELKSLATLLKHEKKSTIQKDNELLLKTALLASDAFIENIPGSPEPVVHGRPIEKAILERGLLGKMPQNEFLKENKRIELIHFESSRRFGGSLNELPRSKKNRLYISGAPETLRDMAEFTVLDGKKIKMTDEMKADFEEVQHKLSIEGMRMIGVAYKDVEWNSVPQDLSAELERGLIYVGLLGFEDPPRVDVPLSIQQVRKAGARVIMLTGDNPETALSIARAVGIAGDYDSVMIGQDIDRYDDTQLLQALKETPVFARVLPEQKLRIATLLKGKGEVVAMTGDGINDAPALRSANIGIAVGSGTEVAKESSDIILLNNSFAIIVAAIEEGRKIIDNLKKIIAYLLSTSISEVVIIGGAIMVGAPLPLLPGQILWANLIEEGLMSFAFAFEKAEKGIMERDPKSSQSKTVLTRELKTAIALITTVTSIFLITLFFILIRLELPIETIRTIMFASLSLDAIFFAFSLKSLSNPVWKISLFDNLYLIAALGLSISLLFAALLLPPLQLLLKLEPLNGFQFLFLFAVGIFNLFTIELVKYIIYIRKRN